MSNAQHVSDDPPHNGFRLIRQYGRLLIQQVIVWLGLVFLLADIATTVGKDALASLPDWLNSGLEFAPWVLCVGLLFGGFRIFLDQLKIYEARLTAVNDRLATYESAKPNAAVGLIGRDGVSNRQDVHIGRVPALRDLDPYEQQWRGLLMRNYEDMKT